MDLRAIINRARVLSAPLPDPRGIPSPRAARRVRIGATAIPNFYSFGLPTHRPILNDLF